MNKLLLFVCYLLLFTTTYGQNSTITGSVIVNFNYTTNNPDVGAEIKLFDRNKKYSLERSAWDSVKQTTTDLDGKYILKNVPPGEYILYISSKGSIADPFYFYSNLTGSLSSKLNAISGFDFSKHREDLREEIRVLLDAAIKEWEQKKHKKYEKLKAEANKKIAEWFSTLPNEVKYFFNTFAGGQMSKEFKQITVKPGIDEDYQTIFKVRY